ncbi:hypothetical protein GCM10009001_20170 [Virgibacillus siamensis]|uniref:Uncharacterized protein n=1 Tax=Virgibacillus siamensis TaxID=480071 RepID=A0ABP3R3X9_9BACI
MRKILGFLATLGLIITISLVVLPFKGNSHEVEAGNNNFIDDNLFELYKNDIKQAKGDKGKVSESSKYIVIEGKGFSKHDFKKYKANKDLFKRIKKKKLFSKEEIRGMYIKEKILVKKAKEKNLFVSTKKAKQYINNLQNLLSKADSNAKDVKMTKEFHLGVRKALGMTKAEYEKYLVEKYQKALSIGKLKSNFYKQYKGKKISHGEAGRAWNNHVKEIVNNASVKINE